MIRVVCAAALPFVFMAGVHADEISFSQQIRGILSDKCFQCHGPDEHERQAGLRLDAEESAKGSLESGLFAIVAGKPDDSELIARITASDPDRRMPPADFGKQLTADEISLLQQWITEGADWGQHWAFAPIERPAVDDTAFEHATVRNPIDHFVLRRLKTAGLSQASAADRVSLIRRVTLDLTGLPPTVDEVEAFISDGSPDAYERVVDRLLASPHYGEHMARYWLDAARYGDTHGLHLDNYREIWAYRDWVIRAFNSNQAFDEFTVEQLAGDLLDQPTEAQLIATGFNRCNVTTSEGGSIAEEVHMRNVVDRVVTTGTVFMGLTLDCSRCHDHKFDPLTMKDFYALYGYFNSIDGNPLDGNKKDHEPVLKVLTDGQKSQISNLKSQKERTEKQLDEFLASIEYSEPANPRDPVLAEPAEFVWIDDAVPAGANAQGNSPWEFVKAPAPVFSGDSSHQRTAKGLSQHFFTDAAEPLKVAEKDALFCYVYLDKANPPKQIMLQWNDGSWEHRAYWGENLIDWGADDSPSRKRMGDLPAPGEWTRLEVAAADVGLAPGSQINGWAFTQFDGTVYWDKAGIVSRLDQTPLYDSLARWESDQQAAGAKSLPEELQAVLKKPSAERSTDEMQQMQRYFFEHAWVAVRDSVIPLKQQLADFEQRIADINDGAATTLIYREKAQPEPAYMLTRGEYDQKGAEVARAVPESLPPLPDGVSNNRLGLAKWLTSDNHPLTSRVTVNRIWQQFFGTGLVKTTEDFGSQGEPPSHPLLLDWLSSEFMNPQLPGAEHRWDVKHLVKLIVMSATYRQTAQVRPLALQRDPRNRLLSRGPRFRLDAELLRDQALALSGLLVEKIGGPSVKPPQPSGLWNAVGFSTSNTAKFTADEGHEKVHRRTLYTFIKRTAPPPQMSTFDAPSREACTVRRERTNSPMQALLMMNDPQYVECARALAEKTLREAGTSDTDRASWMLRHCVLRTPLESEAASLVDDFHAYQTDFKADPEAARKLINIGAIPPSAEFSATDLAAWTMVANLILNLDEIVSK
ncbi:MAG: PSD1 and planctomycete cytochrome C domain-containing protein [Planctomycetaceae bacterium]